MINLKRMRYILITLLLTIMISYLFQGGTFASSPNAIKPNDNNHNIKVVSIYPQYDSKYSYAWNDIGVKFSVNIKPWENYRGIRIIDGKKSIVCTLRINKDTLILHPASAFSFDEKYTLVIPENAVAAIKGKQKNTKLSYKLSPDKLIDLNKTSRIDYKTSAEEFYNFFAENYPFLQISKELSGYDFIGNKKDIINKLASSKDIGEFNANVLNIINRLMPGTHTRPLNMTLYSPAEISFIYLNGEYIVVNSSISDVAIGDTISKINDINIDEYIKNSNNVLVTGMDIGRSKIIASSGTFLSDASVSMTIVNSNNVENVYKISMNKMTKNSQNNGQLYAASSADVVTKIVKDNEIAYLSVPTFKYVDMDKVDSFISSVQNYKYLIVDMRNNVGGSMLLSKELMERVASKPKSITNYICVKNTPLILSKNKLPYNYYDQTQMLNSNEKNSLSILPQFVKKNDYSVYKVTLNIKPNKVHFNGKIYVLTNNICFSAAEYFCNTVQRIGAAVLVGDYTRGDGILFEPVLKSLLYDLVNISYSYTLGIEDDGTINQLNHTKPDYYVEQNKSDYINYLNNKGDFSQYDTVLNECLNIIDKDSGN